MMRVVVGRALRTQTPVLEQDMKYLIFWPYWNVPPSILRAEIIPKITKDPAYIQKNNFDVATHSGQVVTDGVVSEEVLAQLRTGQLMVRQKPGPKNALGLIKFIFPGTANRRARTLDPILPADRSSPRTAAPASPPTLSCSETAGAARLPFPGRQSYSGRPS